MKYILLVLFTAFSISLNAQMSPPTVTRSGTSLTQQDNYLTVAKRLGIPTSATDDLDAAVTAQNSIKLLYNTTLNQLRVYNPLTLTWSGIGGDGDFIPLAGTEIGKPVTGTIDFDWSDTEIGASAKIDYDEGIVISRKQGDQLHIANLQAGVFTLTKYTDTTSKKMNLSIEDSSLVLSPVYLLNGIESNIVGFKGSKVFKPFDSTYFVQKKYVDSVFSTGGGGGSSYSAKNGIYIDSDTIKLGGNITEDTKLDNPNSKSVQIGSDGDAMNLNVVPPFPYSGLISSYSGYDYRSAEYMSFIGVLKGLNFAPFGFSNQDMVGNFTIVGNPFDSIYPDGSIMIDGVWNDEGEVSMKKVYLTFLGGDITVSQISQFKVDQSQQIQGDNGTQSNYIEGDNGNQSQTIIGDNGNQIQLIEGDNANQIQLIKGENGKITRSIIDSVNNANATEQITDTSYLFFGQKIVGIDTISAWNSISPNGFVREFKNGSIVGRDTLNENMYKVEAGSITLKLDSAGLNYGTFYSPFNLSNGVIKYESSGVTDTLTLKSTFLKINPTFLGFYNKEPILQPVLPLGSSTDDVIQALQNLGLVREY